tara:strand:- start:26414 stop:27082 length:669 start_codon:yes stop_codon:yes gene_type:complete
MTEKSMIDIFYDVKNTINTPRPLDDGVSDKHEYHTYLQFYENKMKPNRNNHIKLLEIGTLRGGSMMLWKRFFTDYEMHGLDYAKDPFNFCPLEDHPQYGQPSPFEGELKGDSNIHLHFGIDSMDVKLSNDNFENNYFDYILDDGDHTGHGQYLTFVAYWSKLKSEGKYFIEDIRSIDRVPLLANFINQYMIDCRITGELAGFEVYDNSKQRPDDIILMITKK